MGYGDIGKHTEIRLKAFGVDVNVYDHAISQKMFPDLNLKTWPQDLGECDFLIFTCSLNKENFHMLNANTLKQCKKDVKIINVARGGLIDESALIDNLMSGHVHSVALDVFEVEPLPKNSYL